MNHSTEIETTEYCRDEYLTIGQLASNLGWSVRFIDGLVRGERLPDLEIDGIRHFRREDVIDWLEQKIQTLDADRVRQLEVRVESSLVAEGSAHLVSRLHDDAISLDVHIEDKTSVLRALTCLAERTGLLYDRDHLFASLVDRESLGSTGMPGGVAICHPRRPVSGVVSTQFLCLLRTLKPVDFGAPDGEGTSVFFLLCAPDDRSHLHGLARVARILHHGVLDHLKSARNEIEIKAAITAAEKQIPYLEPLE